MASPTSTWPPAGRRALQCHSPKVAGAITAAAPALPGPHVQCSRKKRGCLSWSGWEYSIELPIGEALTGEITTPTRGGKMGGALQKPVPVHGRGWVGPKFAPYPFP